MPTIQQQTNSSLKFFIHAYNQRCTKVIFKSAETIGQFNKVSDKTTQDFKTLKTTMFSFVWCNTKIFNFIVGLFKSIKIRPLLFTETKEIIWRLKKNVDST